MKLYEIRQTQFLPVSQREAWSFFSDPRNLEEITPATLRFNITNIAGEGDMYAGQLIHYRITILPLVRVGWLTEITHVREGEFFVDEQRHGPYALWHHQHHFRNVEGGTEMTDVVTYALPLGWVGMFAHRIFVARRLRAIFAYRRWVLEKKFNINISDRMINA